MVTGLSHIGVCMDNPRDIVALGRLPNGLSQPPRRSLASVHSSVLMGEASRKLLRSAGRRKAGDSRRENGSVLRCSA